MAVKIRLQRHGKKDSAFFHLVVADGRAPRDGRFIEKIGTYNPLTNPATIVMDEDKAFDWLMKGAQPSDVVKAMLSYRGVMMRKHLQIGVIKGAVTQENADKRLADWKQEKDTKIASKRENLTKSKADAAKARKEAESKVREARAEAIRKKQEAAVAAATATPAAAEGEAAPATEEQA